MSQVEQGTTSREDEDDAPLIEAWHNKTPSMLQLERCQETHEKTASDMPRVILRPDGVKNLPP